MAAAKKVTARSQFVAEVDGKVVVVIAGARFLPSDPVVKAHPKMFEPSS